MWQCRGHCRPPTGTVARTAWLGRGATLHCHAIPNTSHRIRSHHRAEQSRTEQRRTVPVQPPGRVQSLRIDHGNGPSLLRLGIAFPHPPHVSETARVQGSSYASIHMSRRDSVAIWLGQFNASAQRFNIDAETLK